ncbi:MAG: type II secretion system F family protein [Candidatus Babeliales bacterium]
MPYFKWYGVDITGTYRSGYCFAPSQELLDCLLIKQEVALLKAQPVSMPRLGHGITKTCMVQLLSQLAVLVHSGVFLADALIIVAEQSSNPYMQEMVYALAEHIHKGISFSDACKYYPHYFTPLMIHTIQIGQETGALASALEQVCEHILMMENFNKELKSAALMPAITFLFFVCIAATIVFGIMPRFIQMLSLKHTDIPPITRFLMHISSSICIYHVLGAVLVIALGILCTTWYYRSTKGKYVIDKSITHIPCIGPLTTTMWSIYYLRSLALLIKTGMPLVPAMRIAAHTIDNAYWHLSALHMSKEVEAGKLLSQAMVQEQRLFGRDIQALVAVGEQSTRLSDLLTHAADNAQKHVKRQLAFYVQVFQPLLLLIIGLCIAGLIAATYIPILTMSSSLGF